MATLASLWTFDAENLTDSGPAGNSTPTTQTNLAYATGYVGGGAGKALTGSDVNVFAEFNPLTAAFALPASIACWVYIATGIGEFAQPMGLQNSGDALTILVSDADPVTPASVIALSGAQEFQCGSNLMLDAWNFIAIGVRPGRSGLFGCVNNPEATDGYAESAEAVEFTSADKAQITFPIQTTIVDEIAIFSGTLILADLIWLYNAGAGRTGTEILEHDFSGGAVIMPTPASRTFNVPVVSRIFEVPA